MEGLLNKESIKIIFDSLPDDVVPLYFPILIDNREAMQDMLADNDIYAPVVWPKANYCPTIDEVTESIYEKILCIPIDQRYDVDDMQRIVEVINKYK